MQGQTHGGKGSAQRKTDFNKFADNWDNIFKKKENDNAIEERQWTENSVQEHQDSQEGR
jgi:hypothetical protein